MAPSGGTIAAIASLGGVVTSLVIKFVDVQVEKRKEANRTAEEKAKLSQTGDLETRKQDLSEFQFILDSIKEDYKRLDGELSEAKQARRAAEDGLVEQKKICEETVESNRLLRVEVDRLRNVEQLNKQLTETCKEHSHMIEKQAKQIEALQSALEITSEAR